MRYWLIELRKQNGLTQKQLAEMVGLSRSYYSEIELGTKTPGGKAAKRIADLLGFDMELFFEEESRKVSQTA